MSTNVAPTWGSPAVFEIDSNTNMQGVDLQLLPDGNIFAASRSDNFSGSMWLWRLGAQGIADPAFMSGSPLRLGDWNDHPVQAVATPDGNVIVAFNAYTGDKLTSVELRRFDASGHLDTSFGAGGVAQFTPATPNGIGAIAVQADGKIVVASPDTIGYWAIDRVNSDGTPDLAFDAAAYLGSSLLAMRAQADGSVEFLGSFGYGGVTATKVNADGTKDPSFSTSLQLPSAPQFIGAVGTAATLMADGSAYVLGNTGSNAFIERLDAHGVLDTTFGASGAVLVQNTSFEAHAITRQADGKLLVAGDLPHGNLLSGALLRFNADGTVDTTFGDGGIVTVPFAGRPSAFDGVAVQADGKIVVTGEKENIVDFLILGQHDITLRFNADGTLDSTFGPSQLDSWFATYTPGAPEVILDAHASVYDADFAAANNYSMTLLTIQRHGGANADDVFGSSYFTSAGAVVENGVTIGSSFESAGALMVYLYGGTQAQVDQLLESITYKNTGANPPATLQLDWTFDDGSGAANSSVTRTTTIWIGADVKGTDASDHLTATAAKEMLEGMGGDDTLAGSAADNLFSGGAGNDNIDGAAGRDTAIYAGSRSDYTITHRIDGGFTVTDLTGTEGTDTLTGIERVQFADAKVALDIDGNAGQAYRLYQAAFDRVPDAPGLGYQINELDTHLTLTQVAANFIASPEFQSTYGNVDDTQFLTLLYRNVLHRAPDDGGLQFHLDEMHVYHESRADELVHFSESPENQANVLGAIEDGIAYIL